MVMLMLILVHDHGKDKCTIQGSMLNDQIIQRKKNFHALHARGHNNIII